MQIDNLIAAIVAPEVAEGIEKKAINHTNSCTSRLRPTVSINWLYYQSRILGAFISTSPVEPQIS